MNDERPEKLNLLGPCAGGTKIAEFTLGNEWFCECGEQGILEDDEDDEE